jgi:hypothetical protein
MKTFINLILLSVLAAAGARADNIVITFVAPDQTGIPGQTLQFFGTITNTDTNPGDGPIYLNFDSLNLALSDAVLNDLFFANVPLDLVEGASSGVIELFDYTLANPGSNPAGTYDGTYGLLGGMDAGAGTAQDNLAQANFSVDAVPEPESRALLGTVVVLLGWLYWRRGTELASRAGKIGQARL